MPNERDESKPAEDDEARALASAIGRTIRQLRADAGLTLQDVADRSGVSQPFLSQLENGRSMPSLLTLHRVARALGTTTQGLLSDEDTDAVSLVRQGEGREYELVPGTTVRFLASGRRTMEPNEVRVRAGSDSGAHLEHQGEELIFVIDGEIEVTVGSRVVRLGPDDTLLYPATMPHYFRAVGRRRARFLMVSSPPSF